jgi:hypothetical protein
MEPVVDIATMLDLFIFVGGLAGFIGTLRGSKFFMDESRMQTVIQWFGVRKVRLIVAAVYGVFGVLAGLRLFG